MADDKIVRFPGVIPDPPVREKHTKQRDLSRPEEQEELFAAELAALGVVYDYATEGYSIPAPEGSESPRLEVDPIELYDMIIVRGHLELGEDTRVSHETLSRYMRLWRRAQDRQVVAARREALRAVDPPQGQRELRRWLDIVCREGAELSQVIMTQWVWLVRRKLYGLPCESQVMPVLQGKQGGGKSIAVRALLSPMDPLCREWTFAQMVDDRTWADLSRCYVGYVEEMAGARKSHINEMKSLITGVTKKYRILGTNENKRITINCTFIGDTNSEVSQIIRDETGNRRFWEIRCKDEIDRKALASIDARAIWGCVSEQDPCPVQASPLFGEIKNLQNGKLKHKSSIDIWMEETNTTPGDAPIPTTQLYAQYQRYCREAGIYDVRDRARFTVALKVHGFLCKIVKRNNKVVRCTFISQG